MKNVCARSSFPKPRKKILPILLPPLHCYSWESCFFREDFSNHEWTRIDANSLLRQSEATADPANSRSFASIRGCLILVGCGHAALRFFAAIVHSAPDPGALQLALALIGA